MEFTREGTSTNKPPLLEGSSNYAYWKVRMTAFLRSLDHDVWQTVVNGYNSPTVEVEGKTVLKPVADWTQGDKNQTHWNDRAMNAMYNGVSHSEFRRISTCTTAKEAWDLLKIVHEGTDIVRQTKI